MNNIFKNAFFGKAYMTRDLRKALFSRKDGDTFDLETEDSYNPVRADGSFLYTKEGYESNSDIISEWPEEINEEELEEYAEIVSESFWSDDMEMFDGNPLEKDIYNVCKKCYKAGIKTGYQKALENK